MFYQATVHILIRGVETQDDACRVVGEVFDLVPLTVVDWAYLQDKSDKVILPIPRPDLKALGYEEGEFVSTSEAQSPCPYCTESMQAIETHYDQDGYSELVLWCPNCEAQQVIKNIPPEEDLDGSA